jgi:Nucleotidyl transferase AbiEii toxin, Type IV TA system
LLRGSRTMSESPNTLLLALEHIGRQLDSRGVKFALVGGMAVSLRAEVRFTRDIDLAIETTSDGEVEALVLALRDVGYRVKALVEHETQGLIATVRLVGPSGVVVDLLSASSGIEREVVQRATRDGLLEDRIPLACSEELLAMKILAMAENRPHDRADALGLLARGVAEQRVRDNLELIHARGFNRAQDLLAKFNSLL